MGFKLWILKPPSDIGIVHRIENRTDHIVPHCKTGSYRHHLLGHLKIANSAKINNTETKKPTIQKMFQQAMFLAMWIKKVPDFCKTIISSSNPNSSPNILHATSINPTTKCNGGGHEP
jgi:hypothetical protein